jgi:hypothetical protein
VAFDAQESATMSANDDPDLPIWGCAEIARVAGIFHPDGRPNVARVYYLVQSGHLDCTKVGHKKLGRWCSTRRRILASLGVTIKTKAA